MRRFRVYGAVFHLGLMAALATAPPVRAQATKLLAKGGNPVSSNLPVKANAPVASSSAKTTVSAPSPASIPSQPASLFDSVTGRVGPIISTIEVHAAASGLETSAPEPFQSGGQEIVSSAGTYGDISRFLQLFPGVVPSSDISNEMMVRGGHPIENLFLVDGIEVPNINQLATLGTTGGFGPMIDSALVQEVELHTGGYDAHYPERLSSVTEIQTLEDEDHSSHVEADGGIQGFGGLLERSVGGGDLLTAGHHGLVNVVGADFGITDLPAYTNELTRFRHTGASGDQLTILNVAGWDSIQYIPCESDQTTTSTVASEYSGWRETTGLELRRVYSANSFGVATISDSEQIAHVQQQEQLVDPAQVTKVRIACPIPAAEYHATTAYSEDSNDAFSTAGFGYQWGLPRVALMAGTAGWIDRPHYQIEQPIGAFSPYSVAPTRADSTSFASDFSAGESGSYAQLTVNPAKPLALSAGARLQTFAFGSHTTLTPRVAIHYQAAHVVAFHAAFAQYAQMPPYVYLLAYPVNRSMVPMRATHEVVGMDIDYLSSQLHIEAYNKEYSHIPASIEYPSVTLHDMADMVGQQFVWLPMNSDGWGKSAGIEVSGITRIQPGFSLRASVAYSRAQFAGLDRVLRPSNFDFPWIVNAAGAERLGRGYEITGRYGYATGRPYTPFDMPDSLAQNRPIYELSQINAVRAPYYSRLDLQVNKDVGVHGRHLKLYGGVDNVMNRDNFLSYVWLPRDEIHKKNRDPVEELYQIPIFPNFGIRFIGR